MQNTGPSPDGVTKLTGPLLRRFLLTDELPHLFLEVLWNILHAVEIPSVLEGVAKQFLFRFPPDHEITIRTRVATTYDLWHKIPPLPLFNLGDNR